MIKSGGANQEYVHQQTVSILVMKGKVTCCLYINNYSRQFLTFDDCLLQLTFIWCKDWNTQPPLGIAIFDTLLT